MFCTNCGKDISDIGGTAPSVCPACGVALGPQEADGGSAADSQGQADAQGATQADVQAAGENPMATPDGYVAERKGGKLTRQFVIIAAVVVVAAIIAVVVNGFGDDLGGHKNPLSIMYYASQKTSELPGGGDVSVKAGYSGISVDVDMKSKLGKDLNSSAFDVGVMGFRFMMADGSIAFGRGSDMSQFVAVENAVSGGGDVLKKVSGENTDIFGGESLDIDFNGMVKDGKFDEDWSSDFMDEYQKLLTAMADGMGADNTATLRINYKLLTEYCKKENLDAFRKIFDEFFLVKCEDEKFSGSFVTEADDSKAGDNRTISFNLNIKEFAKAFAGYIGDICKDEKKLKELGFTQEVLDLISEDKSDIDSAFEQVDSQLDAVFDSEYMSIGDALGMSVTVGKDGVLKELTMSLDVAGTEGTLAISVDKAGDSSLDEAKLKEEIGKATKFDGSTKEGWMEAGAFLGENGLFPGAGLGVTVPSDDYSEDDYSGEDIDISDIELEDIDMDGSGSDEA